MSSLIHLVIRVLNRLAPVPQDGEQGIDPDGSVAPDLTEPLVDDPRFAATPLDTHARTPVNYCRGCGNIFSYRAPSTNTLSRSIHIGLVASQ